MNFQDTLIVLTLCGSCLITGFGAGWKLAQMISRDTSRKNKRHLREEVLQLTVGEKRILRALSDEPNGRLIVNYVKVYQDDLRRLVDIKEYVQVSNSYHYLTSEGEKIAQEYLDNLLN